MGAALDLLIGEQGKEALDLVDPRRGCRGEVHLPAGSFGKPVADQFGLMARRVVHDDVDVGIGGYMFLEGVEEAAEFCARWRGMHAPMMVPALTSRAANSEVVPCRLQKLGATTLS